MKKSTSFGSRVKKRLSDITNMNYNQKSPLNDLDNVAPVLYDSSNKNYVQQLIKEKAVMMKFIQEKDKIIESDRRELQKLRVNLQRTQLQNFQLAQSNTQMLADLNMCKDKLKVQQHDIACKDALYKAMKLHMQGSAKMQCEENSVLEKEKKQHAESSILEAETKPGKVAVDQPKQDNINNEINVPKTKRGRVTRSQSLGDTSSQPDIDKEIADNKRQCLRRQSVRLKPRESEADLIKIDVSTPLTESSEQHLHASNSEAKDANEYLSQSPKHSLPEKPSIRRPLRKAAAKIQSYKDIPLNTKMRRP